MVGYSDNIEDIITESDALDSTKTHSIENVLVSSINTISNIFDYLYFFRSIGLIKDSNFLYRNVNKGHWGSKFWSLSLVFAIKKSINNCWKLFKYKVKLNFYIQNFDAIKNQSHSPLNGIILNKLKLRLNKIHSLLFEQIFEVLQNLLYFIISILDILKNVPTFNVSKDKWEHFKHLMETVSNFLTIFRFSVNSYNVLKVLQ